MTSFAFMALTIITLQSQYQQIGPNFSRVKSAKPCEVSFWQCQFGKVDFVTHVLF